MRSVQKRTKRKSSIDVTNVFGAGLTGDAIFAPRFIAPQVPPTGKRARGLALHQEARGVFGGPVGHAEALQVPGTESRQP
jgi:hypothetical protein